MQLSSFSTLRAVPGYPRLAVSVLLLGTANSFAGPFISLFGVTEAHMSPLALGVFMTLLSVSSIAVSTWLARLSDRHASRKPMVLLALAAAAVGYALMSFTRQYLPLTLIACVFLATGAAAFPQLFAFARAQLGRAGGAASEHGVTTLRSVFSLAWVVGPAVGAVLLSWAGFRGLFLATSLSYLLAGLPILGARARAPGASAARMDAPAAQKVPRRPTGLIALSFVLYGTSASMGSIALPIFVTRVLGGSNGDVGLLVGLCALLEIPIMLSFVLLPRRFSNESLIVFGFALFALYFVLVANAHGTLLLLLAQAVRAVVIAIAACLGMAYFQELMPNRIAAATTLYANTTSAGSMLAGIVSGAWAQAFGYRSVFWLCIMLTVTAWALLFAVTRKRVPER